LRYLAPALVLGLALLPVAPPLRDRAQGWASLGPRWRPAAPTWGIAAACGLIAAAAIAIGYPVQRAYLRDRYANPDFTAPGLNAAFKWARSVSGARIATTSTRQYPLFGTDLSNRVEFVGIERRHGGFVAPESCRAWRRTLNEGDYDYVVASRDRIEPGKPLYPLSARWTAGPETRAILRKPPTVIFKLRGPLDPSGCR
jgi:hypothetical protein